MPHPDLAEFERLYPAVMAYQRLAEKHNINDIFQDNGGKQLELLLRLNLKTTGNREGNDAYDENNAEFELKTVNIRLTESFSTHHHLNPVILEKYRKVDWYFAIYSGIELVEIWKLKPADLEVYYSRWDEKWKDSGDINNPKIPVAHVRSRGTLIYKKAGIRFEDCLALKRAKKR